MTKCFLFVQDDGRGLAQGVHDSSRARAPIYILLDESIQAQSKYRRYSQYLHHPLKLFLASSGAGGGANAAPVTSLPEWNKVHVSTFAPMAPLPKGVFVV